MNGLCTIYENDGNRRKTPKEKVKIEQNKHLFGFPLIPPFIKLEADCFPVFELTENKPDIP